MVEMSRENQKSTQHEHDGRNGVFIANHRTPPPNDRDGASGLRPIWARSWATQRRGTLGAFAKRRPVNTLRRKAT